MTLLIAGLVVFIAVHSFSMLREARVSLIARMGGENAYKVLFSLLSLAGFVAIIVGFGQYRDAGMTVIWSPPAWGRHAAMLIMLGAFIALVATYIPSYIRATIHHPMITAVMLWAFAHLLVNGDLGSLALFGTFFAWGVMARLSMGRRTTTIFATSPQSPPLGMQNDIAIIVVGAVLYGATLIWLHPLLIGVPIIAV